MRSIIPGAEELSALKLFKQAMHNLSGGRQGVCHPQLRKNHGISI